MASNKGKTHMAALSVNVPPETNGGCLAYPSAAQDTENPRATTVRETPEHSEGLHNPALNEPNYETIVSSKE